MSFAVIKTGGKQYKVAKDQTLKIERIEGEQGGKVAFEEVLLLADEDGSKIEVGDPFIKGAKVEAEILEQGRARKINVIKFKSKVRYKRKHGHRQLFTQIKVVKI
ncbi:MAG: 50S ribosomal protein L21 [Patescibacteria group bacterium]